MAQQTITHREQGFKWVLPKFLVFNDMGIGTYFGDKWDDRNRHRSYTVLGYRCPKAGEWFISGARACAYYMPNDSDQKHIVVRPSEQMYQQKNVINWFPIN